MTFIKLREDVVVEMEALADIFSEPISDEPAVVERQMKIAEGHYSRLQYLLAWADSFLDRAERDKLPEKSKDITDFDRQKMLASNVAEERRVRNLLRGQVKAMEVRIQVCQSSLAFHRESRFTNRELKEGQDG